MVGDPVVIRITHPPVMYRSVLLDRPRLYWTGPGECSNCWVAGQSAVSSKTNRPTTRRTVLSGWFADKSPGSYAGNRLAKRAMAWTGPY